MTQKIYWCLGLPASGKSTKAKEMVDAAKGKLKRINKDDLRALLDNYDFSKEFSKQNEVFVLKIRDNIIMEALMAGLSVIIDDTNFGDKHPLRFAQLALEYTNKTGKPCEVEKLDFTDVPVAECIDRDARRGDKSVGKGVILRMYNQFLKKEGEEPIEIPYKSRRPVLPVYKPPVDGLPKVVICDLDGTLADISVRESMGLMFDASRCDELDTINEPVLITLKALMGSDGCDCGSPGDVEKVIFMSGRMEKDRAATLRFLKKCGFGLPVRGPYALEYEFELHMRKTGDMRKDAIIKRELFEANVHGKYNPVLVLDDRNSVIDLWRKEIGLPTFQVAYGNF